jgi:FecR protein
VFSIRPIVRVLALGIVAFSFTAAAAEDDSQLPKQAAWHVSRSSGDVWLVAPGAQQASLSQEAALNPGDTIRTGPNGRVLLTRGAESMMVAPNSVVGLPTEAKDGMSTTIVQRAGSVLLDVEKRNVHHFAVETPYLAAVVKGTRFQVTVTASGANVTVSRGQVEVVDFKSGQIAQVLPGQMAKVSASGQSLSLSGSGSLLPIERGQPRTPTIDKIVVPRGGFTAPRAADGLQVRSLNAHGNGNPNGQTLAKHDSNPNGPGRGAIHVSTALGDVKLNFSKVTHGMARGVGPASAATRGRGNTETVWNSNASAVNAGSLASGNGNSAAVTAVTTVTSAPAAAIASTSGSTNAYNQTSANQGNGNGNGNAGNGNNGSGNAGNGNAGNGNNGNGNGNQANNGVGNGNGNGNGRGRK